MALSSHGTGGYNSRTEVGEYPIVRDEYDIFLDGHSQDILTDRVQHCGPLRLIHTLYETFFNNQPLLTLSLPPLQNMVNPVVRAEKARNQNRSYDPFDREIGSVAMTNGNEVAFVFPRNFHRKY